MSNICTFCPYFKKTIFRLMKKILLLGILLALPIGIIAQYSGQLAVNNSAGDGGVTEAILSYASGSISDRASKTGGLDLDAIQGSPYVNNSFQPTSLFYDNEKVEDIFYRYNAYNEEVEIKSSNLEDADIRGLDRDKKIKILIEDNPLSFKTFIDETGLTQNGYLIQIKEGKYKAYKRINVKYTEGQRALNSLTKATPPRFSHFYEYYLEVEGNNRIDEVVLRNRQFIKLLPQELQSKVKTKFKEEGFKIKSVEDYIKALNMVENMDS